MKSCKKNFGIIVSGLEWILVVVNKVMFSLQTLVSFVEDLKRLKSIYLDEPYQTASSCW